jgi:glycosyltransferase involved in cell wall biosynthesis
MKILFIHDDTIEPGGANIYRKQLSYLLRDSGIEVFLFTFNANHNKDSEHCCWYQYKSNMKFLRYISNNYFHHGVFIALKKWIRKIQPDIIHINHNFFFSTTVLLACKTERIPVIQTVHDHRIICPSGKGFTPDRKPCARIFSKQCYLGNCISLRDYMKDIIPRLLRKFLHKKIVAAFLIPSKDLLDKMEIYNVPAVLFPHCLDTSLYPVTPLDMKTNNITFAGRLHEGKGVAVLIEAFGKVLKQLPGANLHLFGDDTHASQLKKLSRDLHPGEQIIFHGLVPHEQMPQYYAFANVIVLPSVWIENSPLIILEAMAAGRPVIGSRIGGIPELIKDGETGLLSIPGDAEDLSYKILQLLTDKEKAEKMGRKGRELVEEGYGVKQHLTEYFKVIRKLNGSTIYNSGV